MLRWTLIFLIIAIIAGALGFFGIAAGAASIAKILFFIFIVLLYKTDLGSQEGLLLLTVTGCAKMFAKFSFSVYLDLGEW